MTTTNNNGEYTKTEGQELAEKYGISNYLLVEGLIKTHTLKEEVRKRNEKNYEKGNYIKGKIVVTNPERDMETEIEIYQNQKKKDGDEYASYSIYLDIMNSKDILSKMEDEAPIENCLCISIKGRPNDNFSPSLSINEYFNENTKEVVGRPQLSVGFSKPRLIDYDKMTFQNDWITTVYVDDCDFIEIENENGEVIKTQVRTYFLDSRGNLKEMILNIEDIYLPNEQGKIEMVASKDDVMDALQGERGIWADLVVGCQISFKETKRTIPSRLGRPRVETTTESVRKFVVKSLEGQYSRNEEEYPNETELGKLFTEREMIVDNLKKGLNADGTPREQKGNKRGSANRLANNNRASRPAVNKSETKENGGISTKVNF